MAIVKALKNNLSAFSSALLLGVDDWLTVRAVFFSHSKIEYY